MSFLSGDVLVCHITKKPVAYTAALTGWGAHRRTFSLTCSLPLSKSPDTCTVLLSHVCGTAHLCSFYNLAFGQFPIASGFALIARETKAPWGFLDGR